MGGKEALAITRRPEVFEKRGIPYLWITKVEGKNTIHPTSLAPLLQKLVDSADQNTVIIFDGLEYLILENGFESVFKFLTTLKDKLILIGATLIVMLDPAAIEEKHLKLLEREFKWLDTKNKG
ncbi:DUF835 domain-containing protein [Thermococcus sp. CX2]|uniref:DUF835 domain-containing protein n=1 Tax=Thermococcus sp. CX2 TaxID=163006 RepID=UPI00143B3489|nr:DUF835 domain-containing protein [Thermococcus sp. CX2]